MVYFVRVSKSGNSYVISLPAPVREALHLGRGDQLAAAVEGDRLVLVKMDDRRTADIVAELKGATS